MRKNITESEKLQLLGLLTLGRQHNKIVDQVNDEISRIIEDKDGYSHMTDALYESGDVNIDELLEKMEIKVENAAA